MATDLSTKHHPVTDLFPSVGMDDRAAYRLSDGQVAQFRRDGFLPGIRLLDLRQIDALRSELADLVQPGHEGADLWYEYHSNESGDPSAVLFHALGAWRIKPAS